MPNICLASCYLPIEGEILHAWTQLAHELKARGSELVLSHPWEPVPGVPFFQIRLPSLIKYFDDCFPLVPQPLDANCGADEIDLLETDVARSQRAYDLSAALKGLAPCRAITEALLRHLCPGCVLVWDNTSGPSRILQQRARHLGIPVRVVERGLLPGTFLLDGQGIAADSDAAVSWLAAGSVQTDDVNGRFEQIREYIAASRSEKYPQPAAVHPAVLRRELKVDAKRLVLLLGQVDAGINGSRGSYRGRVGNPVFTDTRHAAASLADACLDIDEVALVFKPHPHDNNSYADLESRGVRVVRDANVYSLIEAADVIAAQFTTLQYECVFYDKPVVLMGRSAWWSRGAAYDVVTYESLANVLRHALNRDGWAERVHKSKQFVCWLMDCYLVGIRPEVPSRRNVTTLAEYICRISADARGQPPAGECLTRFSTAIERFQ